MALTEFPSKTPQSLGQFWLPAAEASQVPGMLSIDRTAVRLEVSPELTSMFTLKNAGPGGATLKAADDQDSMVILGSIPLKPLKVTLWDAYTTAQSQIGGIFFPGRRPGLSRQEFKSTWCVAGEHFADPNTPLYGVRPDVTNLAEWARIPSLATTVYPQDPMKLDWHMNVRNTSLDAKLASGAGYLTLTPSTTSQCEYCTR